MLKIVGKQYLHFGEETRAEETDEACLGGLNSLSWRRGLAGHSPPTIVRQTSRNLVHHKHHVIITSVNETCVITV
jgi:hypothetical protein